MSAARGAASRVIRKLETGVSVPPDPEGMNDERAAWADDALQVFASSANMRMSVDKPEVVSDLIANIHHWCDRNGVDFEHRVANAAMHYEAETTPDEAP